MMRFSKNLHGRTGSLAESALVTYRSQTRRTAQRQPDTDNNEMTYADLQGYSESASSNPAVNDKTARTRSIVPRISTRAIVDLTATLPESSELEWTGANKPKFLGMPTAVTASATAEIGTLRHSH